MGPKLKNTQASKSPPTIPGGAVTIVEKTVISKGRKNRKKNKSKRSQNFLGLGALSGTGGKLGVGNTFSSSRSKRDMIIEESEYVAEVTVANQPNFNVTSFGINPGNATLFPWLSSIAKQFEKYQFERLCFVYKKEVSEFATNGQTGKVILSVDFDAADPLPATKQQMEDTVPHADAMPCESFALRVDARDLKPASTDAKYVRAGGVPGGTDIKTYDLGNLNVATIGSTVNAAVGELHVVYRVKLMKPVLENLAGAPANRSAAAWSSSANTLLTTATPLTVPFATLQSNGLAIVNTAGSFVPPPGNYIISVFIEIGYGGSGTVASFAIQKNGVTTGGIDTPTMTFTAASLTTVAMNQTIFFSANGTDALTVAATSTFSTSNSSVNGNIVFLAV